MPIQDNVNGALLISAIDFILSFVIIGGIGVILALFPLLNRFRKRDDKLPLNVSNERSALKKSGSAAITPATSTSTQSAATVGIHPGLSDQQLVALLTAAAHEALGRPVRVYKFRPLNAKDRNWATQGRQELQSHRLK
jgi:hypothetical protein